LAEAAEGIVRYLRTQFEDIRVLVPLSAMSAATMLALAANEVVMGRHSQLGPIDPQFVVSTPEGPRAAPAQAILDQFDKAKDECKNPANLPAWMPILRGYGPGLLAQCEHQRQLAEELVTTWLKTYMFGGEKSAAKKAKAIASWFADYKTFKSHSRVVRIEDLQGLDPSFKVKALEEDGELQDAVLSVHHATMHTLSAGAAVKIIENHTGRAWVKIMPPPGPALQLELPTQAPAQLPRSERRRQQRGK
jgi:hypothetical protein